MKAVYPDLQHKVILVTGATRGIGRAIALDLARQKSIVVFNYRPQAESLAQSLKEEIRSLGTEAYPLPFDLQNLDEAKKALDEFHQQGPGPISGLVNNAGISKDQLILRLKENDVQNILDINLKAPMMISSILSRTFLKATDVSVVNVSSIVGLMGNASQVAYAASKAGLIGLTKSMAKELASRNIRCNAICPGFIQTEMTDELSEDVKKTYQNAIPLGRFGSTEEVSSVVQFLLSKASSYITGEVIKIDGGMYI